MDNQVFGYDAEFAQFKPFIVNNIFKLYRELNLDLWLLLTLIIYSSWSISPTLNNLICVREKKVHVQPIIERKTI